jgi:hypothetical protein
MLADWVHRLRSLFRRDAVERELDGELRFHFEQLVERHVRQGLDREDAIRRARLQFGGFDQIKEAHREARGVSMLTDLGRDVRYALRQFRRSPGFAALAVVCLGLGIGVNTSIFGVMSAVLFRPMPVFDPDRLVAVTRGEQTDWSFAVHRDFEQRSRLLSGLTASLAVESDVEIDGESEFAASEIVPAN